MQTMRCIFSCWRIAVTWKDPDQMTAGVDTALCSNPTDLQEEGTWYYNLILAYV